jgi:hypothetical protein
MTPDFEFKNLSQWAKNVTYCIVALCAIGILSDPYIIIQTIVGLVVGYFFAGPYCWQIAYKKGRSTNFAFLFGFVFSLIGLLFYWLYSLFFKDIE